MMRRCALVVLLILIVPTGTANTNSVVKIDHSFTLIDYDPGIESVSNHDSSEWVVVAGASGYAIVMDKNSPSTMIPLAAVTKEDLLDSDYHPGGKHSIGSRKEWDCPKILKFWANSGGRCEPTGFGI